MRTVVVMLLLVGFPAFSPAQGVVPRTAWGDPDLQGVWDYRTVTPLERPDALAGKATLTTEEASAFEQEFARGPGTGDLSSQPGATAAEFELWIDFGTRLTDKRTSLIVDPPDGKIPARTATGQQQLAAIPVPFLASADGPEDRVLSERCLMSNVPVQIVPSNSYLQVFQTEEYVAVVTEFGWDVRIIPLDTQAIIPARLRQWKGITRGHWNGDTLVVETTRFNGRASHRGSGSDMRLVERFTRVGADTLRYEYTVDDAESFTRPWSALLSMTFSDAALYEYACHEGNYSMPLILNGARALEREEAASR